MSEEQVDYVELWIALFKKAANLLGRDQFDCWLLGVGSSGAYEERCRVGEAILELMKPDHLSLSLQCSTYRPRNQPLNAISPDAGGAPSPRGVR